MKKLFLLGALIFITTNILAQKPIEMPVWPDDPSAESMLFVYKAEKPNGIAIIMCPGGGYSRLAMDHEGHDMASWINTQGITYIILKYRMPNGNHKIPLADAEQAMRIVRQHADQWNIDRNKIGIMGASAGGHLASTLSTHYGSPETRPDFQILFYPVITMNINTHGGSKKNLLGPSPSQELIDKFSNEKQVTKDTPKAFIMLSTDDKAVVPANGVNYYLALVNNGVSAALHTYPVGGHGWGFRDNFTYKRQWTDELEKWIREEIK